MPIEVNARTEQIVGSVSTLDLTQVNAGLSGGGGDTNGVGTVIQTVYAEERAFSTITGNIPHDDTIPQNTEGGEVLTVAITPTSSSSVLLITGYVVMAPGSTNFVTVALFQDSIADAIDASCVSQSGLNFSATIPIQHKMVAGTTSEITFKIRVGGTGSDTYINGDSVGRNAGGSHKTFIQVQELSPVASVSSGIYAGGKLVQEVIDTYTTYSSNSTSFAGNDNIPQDDEGAEILSATITPTNANNILIFDVTANAAGSGSSLLIAALFDSTDADAISAIAENPSAADFMTVLNLQHSQVAGGTSALTFNVRVGATGGTTYINGNSAGRRLGGTIGCVLRIREVSVDSVSVAAGGKYQGNNGNVNASLGVGDIFRTHTNLLEVDTTIPTGQNALAAGPLTVDDGVTLTVDGELVIA